MVRHTDYIERWDRVALHLVRIGTLMAIWAIAQYLRIDPFEFAYRAGGYRLNEWSPITALGNQTLTGNFLCIIAPLALMFKAWRYRILSFGTMGGGDSLLSIGHESLRLLVGYGGRPLVATESVAQSVLGARWACESGSFVWKRPGAFHRLRPSPRPMGDLVYSGHLLARASHEYLDWLWGRVCGGSDW